MSVSLDLSCCCGAHLVVTALSGTTVRVERAAFDRAHQVCRGHPNRPPPRPRPAPLPDPLSEAPPP